MNFERLHTREEIVVAIEAHNAHSDFIVLDTETTDKLPRRASLLDVQISGREEQSAFIFAGEFADTLLGIKPSVVLVAHNYKYDAHVLFRHGVDLLDRAWRDTLLLGHLLDENRESYSLDSYVQERWGDGYKAEFWERFKGTGYGTATETEKQDYACRDVVYTRLLYESLMRELQAGGIPLSLIEHVHELQRALLKTEIEGVCVDEAYLRRLGVKLHLRLNELEPKMREVVKDEIEIIELKAWEKELEKRKTPKGRKRIAKPAFNFESGPQLQALLYGGLGLPEQRNDKTKQISTDYEALDRLKHRHSVIELIQEHRELKKIDTTFVGGMFDRIDQSCIYPEFRVAGTLTGRISHSNPNLAQFPKTGGVRGLIIPSRGRVLVAADYSQLEVLLEAHLTKDGGLIGILERGESKHDLTARELGCDRHMAKTLNFCLQYWGSAYKVQQLLNCSNSEAKRIWNRYWEIYSGPKRLKATTDKAVNDGTPLVTAYGRKRRFPVKERQEWDGDYRQAYNFLIQGTGADITSQAFYQMDHWFNHHKCGRVLFSVHDEILIEVDRDRAEETESVLIHTMEGISEQLKLILPLKVESSGLMDRWED